MHILVNTVPRHTWNRKQPILIWNALFIRRLRTLSVSHALGFSRCFGRPVLSPIGNEIDKSALIMPDSAILVYSIFGTNIIRVNGGLGVLFRFRFFLDIGGVGFAFGCIGLSGG